MANNEDVSAELAAVFASRRQLADRVSTPWWYYPVLGALSGLAVLAVGNAFDRSLFILPFAVLGMTALGSLYRHRTGVDLRGAHAPNGGMRGRIILGAVMVCFCLCYAGSWFLGREVGWDWAPWVLAGGVFLTATIAGPAYDGRIRAQLRGTEL